MRRQRVVLKSNANNIVTLSYDGFDWDKFIDHLKDMGLEVTKQQKIYCG